MSNARGRSMRYANSEVYDHTLRSQLPQSRLQGVTVRTSLLKFPLCAEDPRTLLLKPENQQPIGAFKLRGAYNKIASLSETERQRGVISYSSGNHAQGVAY